MEKQIELLKLYPNLTIAEKRRLKEYLSVICQQLVKDIKGEYS